MELASGREASITIAEAVDDDGWRSGVAWQAATARMIEDEVQRHGAHDYQGSHAHSRPSSKTVT
jgi:hypothetical protein